MTIINSKPATTDVAVKLMHRTIAKLAHKFARNHKQRDYDDLYMAGVEGLLIAYNKWDDDVAAARGNGFSTYAYYWIWALIKTAAVDNYDNYNNTSNAELDDVRVNESYEMANDDMIDWQNKMSDMDATDRAIVRARAEGFTFREIADAMTKLGQPITLHQCRNKYLAAVN